MKGRLSRWLAAAGATLILMAVLLAVGATIFHKNAAERARQTAVALLSTVPSPHPGVPDDRTDTAMPMLDLDGKNYVGVLEAPRFNVALPVGEGWSSLRALSFPCRFQGSVYDRSLVIGGSGGQGQLSFARLISPEDTVFFTDMTGARFSYRVSDVRRLQKISQDTLGQLDADLILFAGSEYSLDYTVVCCTQK